MARTLSECIARDSIYSSRELRRRFRIGDTTWRKMRRGGLRTTQLGKVVLVEGAEFIRYCSEEADRQVGFSGQRQVRQCLAQYAGEFEAVPRHSGGEGDLRELRMDIDDEMFIGRHRIHARLVIE